MANTGVVSANTSTPGEFPAVKPDVYVNGKKRNDYECISVELNAGIVPSKAVIRWTPAAILNPAEEESPTTLDVYVDPDTGDSTKENHGSRVVIRSGESTIFAGHLLMRSDSGVADTVLWTAYDDREIMTKIPVRGAVVRDDFGLTAKFLPRYEAHTNPNGYWNCIGWTCDIAGHPLNGKIVPVFASRGHIKVSYESPDNAFTDTLSVSEVTAWTPRRFLTYLYLIAHMPKGAMDGIPSDSKVWRSLLPKRSTVDPLFDWSYDSIKDMVGLDAGESGTDPLDRKMADMRFQGNALLQAISDTLTTAGTHDIMFTAQGSFDVVGGGDDQVGVFNGKATTLVEMFEVGKTATMNNQTTYSAIPLMRSGRPSDLPNVNTAYDFQLSEDSTNTRMSCMVEGDVIRTETRVTIDNGLLKGWSPAEETAFKQVIWGDTSSSTSGLKYAKYPTGLNLTNSEIPAFSTWATADGTGGKELAYAYSAEAVQLARRLFPRVFRAFYIDSADAEISAALDGFADKFADTSEFPQGQIVRPVLPNQLQYQLADLSAGGGVENSLGAQLPIRVTVKNVQPNATEEWVDAGWTSASMLGEGLFLIDLAEQLDSTPQCIYSGHLYRTGDGLPLNTLDCALKDLRINLAMPMDHRVYGYQDTASKFSSGGISDWLYVNANYAESTGGEFLQYIDSGSTYREEHQVDSYPVDDDPLLGVINRILPPGSEASNAQYAAQRRLYQSQRINRLSSWKMVGIRPEWKIGQWITQVDQIAVGTGGTIGFIGNPYKINAPIRSLVFDFHEQDTTIGGLIGESF